MSTLMRAKAALVLVALLSMMGAGPAVLAAPVAGGEQGIGVIALRHTADGAQTRIILEGTAELPYTIYRPDERTILVDLPGVDASKLEETYAVDSRSVERIQVERLRTASGQSLARLRIRLLAPVDDRTVVEGKSLILTLAATTGASATPATATAAPPPPKEQPVTMRAEVPVAKPAAQTVVSPLSPAAAVPSTAATVISNVRTDVQGANFRAFITTDGRASFKHFVLPNPDRIVLDITGVRSTVERNAIEINNGGISRIRVGQFRTADPKVVRIVFDVAKMGPYDIRQVGNNVVLTLGPEAGNASQMAAPAPTPSRTAAAPATKPEPAAPRPAVKQPLPPPVVTNDSPAAAPAKSPAKAPAKAPAKTPAVAAPEPAMSEPAPKDPARNPVMMSTPTPVRPVSEEIDPQAGATRPAQKPAVVPQRNAQAGQAVPPAPMVPKASQGGYLTEGFVGRPVNLDLKNVDLRDVLRFLHNRFNVNFIVDKSVPKDVPVDVSVKDIPWNQALDSILKSQSLGAVREEGGIVRIATLASIAAERDAQRKVQESFFLGLPLMTKIFRLKYASPIPRNVSITEGSSGGGGSSLANSPTFDPNQIKTGIYAFIKNRLSTRGRIEFDVRSNSIIVTDLAQRIEVIEEIIRALDRPEPQVEIEARIVIAKRDYLRDLGVQLSAAVINTNTGGAAILNTIIGDTLPATPGGLPTPTALEPGGSLVSLTTGVLGTFQISANIIAAERKAQVRTIAAPRVTTQNNTTAEVVNGVQIPVQTVSNNTITTTFVDAALKLQITPQVIVEDGAILLTVIAENNSVSQLRTIGGTPGIDEQSARGIVLVPDGGTTVLGGINIDQESQSEDRTPGLSRIPIFGNLFKRRTTGRDTQEILFFITPRIFRPEMVGLTQESTLRASDITITPVIQGLESAPAVGGALRFDSGGSGGASSDASGQPVP